MTVQIWKSAAGESQDNDYAKQTYSVAPSKVRAGGHGQCVIKVATYVYLSHIHNRSAKADQCASGRSNTAKNHQ